MTEPLLDHLRMHAPIDEPCGIRVPKVMEGRRRVELRQSDRGTPDPEPKACSRNRTTSRGREQQRIRSENAARIIIVARSAVEVVAPPDEAPCRCASRARLPLHAHLGRVPGDDAARSEA